MEEIKIPENNAKKFRNAWLVSILLFVITIVGVVIASMKNTDGSLGYLGLGAIFLFMEACVGSLLFIIWIYKIGNKVVKNIFKIFGIFIGILLLLVVLWVILFRYAIVDGASMEPTYKNGDIYLVSKFVYKSTDPQRGDVIDYSMPENGGERVGRIVGLPNETIQLKPNIILVNEKQIDEPYADWSKWAENREQNISLKDNEYLVLFDKRDGNIQVANKKDIIGKFIFKLK
ncbi:MAG: signal peptidase I [Ignavibacteria bacterium]|nr:signal peptidase I [Ignavibacteria bacterium]